MSGGPIFGILLVIIIVAFGAFFIQSGQLGSLNFGRINFGVPLESLGQQPIIKYNAPGGQAVATSSSGSSVKPATSRPVVGTSSAVDPRSGQGFATTLPLNLPFRLPPGIPSSRFSVYFGRIKIASLTPGSASSLGKATIKAVFTTGEKINVTGWYLQATHGGWYIPKAVNIYDPSGLAEATDIFLTRGEVINMYSTMSPVGINFRLNLCTGYLGNVSKFNPGLPRDCPGSDKATLRNFSSQCQDYVPSAASSCKEPKSNPPIPYYDEPCRAYLQNFSFRGCFNLYRSDSAFLKPEWRVWMGSTFLNPRHDRVFLLDRDGYLVDWREY